MNTRSSGGFPTGFGVRDANVSTSRTRAVNFLDARAGLRPPPRSEPPRAPAPPTASRTRPRSQPSARACAGHSPSSPQSALCRESQPRRLLQRASPSPVSCSCLLPHGPLLPLRSSSRHGKLRTPQHQHRARSRLSSGPTRPHSVDR